MQGLVVVPEADKRDALRALIKSQDIKNALVFCNRKRDVALLHTSLKKHGFNAGALHGDMSQPARIETLETFKAGEIQILVASDVAARGLDIVDMSHVFNFDVPFSPEDYVHRIGRTGRAGKTGHSFTLASPSEGDLVAGDREADRHDHPRIEIPGLEATELRGVRRPPSRPWRPPRWSKRRRRSGGRAASAPVARVASRVNIASRASREQRAEHHDDRAAPSGRRASSTGTVRRASIVRAEHVRARGPSGRRARASSGTRSTPSAVSRVTSPAASAASAGAARAPARGPRRAAPVGLGDHVRLSSPARRAKVAPRKRDHADHFRHGEVRARQSLRGR